MDHARPLASISIGGREVAVGRVALRCHELAAVMGEGERNVLDRLQCGDLPCVTVGGQWAAHVVGAVALVEGKVAAGQLGQDALDALIELVRGPARPKVRELRRPFEVA